MESFTSTGMTGLLFRSIERTAPDLVSDLRWPDPMTRAVMPDTGKRELIARVLDAAGPGMLLGVGQNLDLADETPVLTVLLRSSEPAVLAEKWMRLERYHHATHRTRIAADSATRWDCRRTSSGEPATVGENCLIAGLLVGLLGHLGARDCRLAFGDQRVGVQDLDGLTLPADEGLDNFVIEWSAQRASAPSAASVADESKVTDRLADLLAGDIGRSWKLHDAARNLTFSTRSLQRHLSATGRSFSSVLRQARMREATNLLTRDDTSLAEIGYCCGYADQAHFQRDFLRATNMTPRRFRAVTLAGHSGAIIQ